MEENILAFLESIHLDSSVVEQLKGEEKLDEETITGIAESYIEERNKYYESQNLSRIESDAKKSGVSGYQIAERKKLNKLFELGLSNSQMDEYDGKMDEYYKIVDKAIKSRIDALKKIAIKQSKTRSIT